MSDAQQDELRLRSARRSTDQTSAGAASISCLIAPTNLLPSGQELKAPWHKRVAAQRRCDLLLSIYRLRSEQERQCDGNDQAGSEPNLSSQVLVDGESQDQDRYANRHDYQEQQRSRGRSHDGSAGHGSKATHADLEYVKFRSQHEPA